MPREAAFETDGGTAAPGACRIYTGILGQVGDILMFTAVARRIKELFPNSSLTFAVSGRYREAGALVAGLPYVDRVFEADLYFQRLTPALVPLWEGGWPVDIRGDDEVLEQRRHDLVFETRPRHPQPGWWEHRHVVEETAAMVGVPGPIDLRTEIRIPPGTAVRPAAQGKIVLHNDPALSPLKAWPWPHARRLVDAIGPEDVVLIGGPPRGDQPAPPGALDLRGKTSLPQAAAIIGAAGCFVGVDSGPMWIAGSLRVPTVGIYGTAHFARPQALQPQNPNAVYLVAEGPPAGISPDAVLGALASLDQKEF